GDDPSLWSRPLANTLSDFLLDYRQLTAFLLWLILKRFEVTSELIAGATPSSSIWRSKLITNDVVTFDGVRSV
ncbi:MAG: hypothetical protein ACK56W_19015, partial [Pirellula sp.]